MLYRRFRQIQRMGLGVAIASLPLTAQALTVANGTVFFEQSPTLEKAVTDFKNTHNRFARYTFVVNVPDNAGEALQRLTLQQTEGVDAIDFRLRRTRAFDQQRQQIPVRTTVTQDETLVIDFAEAIQPGSTVTLTLRPERNPQRGGVYLFGVTAFPEGAKPHGQFLGYGRLHFFQTGGRGRS